MGERELYARGGDYEEEKNGMFARGGCRKEVLGFPNGPDRRIMDTS